MVLDNAGVLSATKDICDNCGSHGANLYVDLHDHLFGSPGTWNLRRCDSNSCGLVWLDPQPLPDQLGKLYSSYYTHVETQPAGAAEHVSYESRGMKRVLKNALALIFFWNANIYRSDYLHLEGMRPGRLLEVGCGDGAFLGAAARKGWTSFGLDFDAAAVAHASKRPGVIADVGELVGKEYPGASFDAIVMNNVIEHLRNPRETLIECRRILRAGGRLVMITPNSDSLGRNLFGRNWRGLEPPRHLYLYNSKALRNLCRQTGFHDLQVGSSPGGSSGREILSASIDISLKSVGSSSVRKEDISGILSKEYLLSLLGVFVGEWLVVIAAA